MSHIESFDDQRQIVSPDGRLLLTNGEDKSATIWDIASVLEKSGESARRWAADPDSLWADLSGDDAPRAYRAVLALEDDPGHAVPLLAARLKPAKPADVGQVARWVSELGSNRAATRASASRD